MITMMNGGVLVYWYVTRILVLLCGILLVEGIGGNVGFRGPSSPCPSIFQYHYDGEEWYGIIIAPSLRYGTPAKLIVRLSIGRVLPSKYSGSLEVLGTRSEILYAMLNEQSIRYRVNFPLSYPSPLVTEITLNNNVLCSGSPVAGPVITSIFLEHYLYPKGQNLNTNVHPQQFPEQIPAFSQPSVNEPTTFLPVSPKTSPSQETDFDSGHHVIERNLYTEVCGSPVSIRPLVANGEPVQRRSYPWLAALFSQKALGIEFTCGANLISSRHVITAAHCIKYGENPAVPADELVIILGKYKIHKWTERGSLVVGVTDVVLHPEYKALNSDADLAIIVLADIINFTPTIRPICMWQRTSLLSEFVGHFGTIVGWGRDETGQKITPEPRQTEVKVVSQEECLRSRLEFRYITSNRTLCAGGQEPGTGPCTGDSGGGLYVQQDGKWFLRGIISMSLADPTTRSCDLNHYSVFVDMAKFVDWVSFYIN